MNVGSLFSGIGGIELGFEREGFKTEWFVEKEPFCQAVLKKHWPTTPIYGGIESVDFSKLQKVDVLTGGFPCQDISVAGKGKGIVDGKRSSLWKYFAEAIGVLRPRYAVIENVSALTFRGLSNVLADLAKEGYDAEWFDLRASDFGALHKRERIFIIAYSKFSRGRCEIQSKEKNGTKVKGRIDEIQRGIASNTTSQRCNCRRNHRQARQVLQTKEWKMEEDKQSRERRELGFDENSPLFITNDWGKRVQRFREETFQGKQGFSWCKDVRRIEDFKGIPDLPEPLICRSRYGLPNRVDRTKSLGNAVVPQVAQFIARRIKEIDRG